MTGNVLAVVIGVVVLALIVAIVVLVAVRASGRPSVEVQALARHGVVQIDRVPRTGGQRPDWLVTPLRRPGSSSSQRERIWFDSMFRHRMEPVLWSTVAPPFAALGESGSVDGIVSDGGG